MSESKWVWQCGCVIPSKAGAGRPIVKDVLKNLAKNGWDKHDIFGIHLALEEAIGNAIRHGNQLDGEKQVKVGCWISTDLFRAEVTDEGKGFDADGLPDPTNEEWLSTPHGRGVMLMRSFMTKVDFNETGNCVILEKRAGDCPDK